MPGYTSQGKEASECIYSYDKYSSEFSIREDKSQISLFTPKILLSFPYFKVDGKFYFSCYKAF